MADQKISELTALTGANVADDDAIAIVDTSATETKKIVFSELKNALDTATGFVRITGDTMTGALDVQSTITSDGLTVDGKVEVNGVGSTTGIQLDNGAQAHKWYLVDNFTNRWDIGTSSLGAVYNFGSNSGARNHLQITTGGDISFYEDTGTTAKFFWDASEEGLGIGNTSFTNKLNVTGAMGSAGTPLVQLSENSGNARDGLYLDYTGTTNSAVYSLKIADASKTHLAVRGDGNVGIGTSSPSAKLHLQVSGNNSNLAEVSRFETANSGETSLRILVGQSNIDTTLRRVAVDAYRADTNVTPIAFTQTTSAGTTERMRIDSSGNLLVGTTDNTIYNNTTGGGANILSDGLTTIARETATTSDTVFVLNDTGAGGSIQEFRKDGAPVGSIGVQGGDAYYAGTSKGIKAVSGFIGATNTTGVLQDNNTDLGSSSYRFKDLYLSENAFLGKTSTDAAGAGLVLQYSTPHGGRAYFTRQNNTSTQTHVSFYTNAGSAVGSITTTASATAYNTSSDYRLKTDAQPMIGATDRLKQLNPVNFEWIADGTRVDGFFAHEVQSVVPEAVTGAKDAMRDEEYEVTPAVLDDDGNVVTEAVMGTRSVPDYQGIDQSKLVPLLVATIKELEARITALENA